MFETTRRDTSRLSFFLFRAAIVVVVLFFGVRLYQLQILEGANYRQKADGNRFDLIEEAAKRGVIYDRNGEILTRNRPSFEIGIVPDDLPVDDPATPQNEETDAITEILTRLGWIGMRAPHYACPN